MFKILVAEHLSPSAAAFLQKQKDVELTLAPDLTDSELVQKIREFDALIVRRTTKVTRQVIEAGKNLKLIGRAGSGVENIDLPAASERGVLVLNAPFGNLVSTAELTFALIFGCIRHLTQANEMARGVTPLNRNFFEETSHELAGRTLGIVGLGKIGQLVAERAKAFGMQILAYDPVATPEVATRVGATLVDVEKILKESDIISLHVPLLPQTKHLIGAKQLKLMKTGVIVINTAQGGVVDETALAKALESGQVASVGMDVASEMPLPKNHPLLSAPNVFLTPHIGGATVEAEARTGLQLAEEVVSALHGELVEHVVNLPFRPSSTIPDQRAWNALAATLARLAAQILAGATVKKAELTVSGELAAHDPKILTLAVSKGLLESLLGEVNVNFLNAADLATKKGLKITVKTNDDSGHYKSELCLTLATSKETVEVRGTVVRGEPRITLVHDFHLEFSPGKYMLITRHNDQPGILGRIGTILGNRKLNIANMEVGRKEKGQDAIMVIELDTLPDREFIKEVESLEGLSHVVLAEL